ncbi:PLD nuclease N-terminal domain-containing protein [Halorubrum amylolyticum]|uniref:PLD nuclease N-terminal domain-containing protein n=1 Tax=Halorubrum amylolyticum TaxID=2508724 RepID=UPI0010093115|nr:PLD nuclease N-terminal domain-containing protein [Halorubrum amylolyticum]
MQPLVAVILVGVPLAWLVAFAAYAYLDAPNHEMNPRKWALICLFVPLFGFFAYVFERGERDYDPSEDPYAPESDARTAGLAVHERRRGEKGLGPVGTEADDVGEAEGEADGGDEWNDPDGIDVDDDG